MPNVGYIIFSTHSTVILKRSIVHINRENGIPVLKVVNESMCCIIVVKINGQYLAYGILEYSINYLIFSPTIGE